MIGYGHLIVSAGESDETRARLFFERLFVTWAARCAETIFPLSLEKTSLANALREWLYVGNMFDYGDIIETCKLCGHPNLRYHFEIVNSQNGNDLLVGSECINRFGIAATDEDGNILDAATSRKRVNRDKRTLVTEASKRRQIASLVQLAAVEKDFDIQSFITYLQDRGAFTPIQLFTLSWKFKQHTVAYVPGDFKMIMNRDREKAQLKSMPDWKIRRLWPGLSFAQREWIKKHMNFKPE